MFRPISLGFSLPSASAVMDECVINPSVALASADVFSPLCSIQGIDSAGGGSAPAWRFQSAGLSDVGCVRSENQDAFGLKPERGLFVLADGMGGHRGGKIASRMAVDGIMDYVQILPSAPPAERLQTLKDAFQLCCYQIHALGTAEAELLGMGTTLVVLHLDEAAGRYYIAHVGDSRLYRIRNGQIEQLTEDHSLQNEFRKVGTPEHQWRLISRSIITRSIGTFETVPTDVLTGELEAGDVFLLCSDGLTEPLSDQSILQIVSSHADLDAACRELIDRANHGGGPDNVTAVLVRALRGA